MVIAVLSRPGDAPGYALRLRAQLRLLWPEGDVQMEWCANAEVVLALVGPNWAEPSLDQRIVAALATALRTGRRIIPVLVQGGRMPSGRELPEGMRPFATINAISLHNESFAAGMQGLLQRMRNVEDQGPWRDDGPTGTIRIVSTNPGALLGLLSRLEPNRSVNVRVDGTTCGSMELFGDEMSLPVVPGRHEVLLRYRFQAPPGVYWSSLELIVDGKSAGRFKPKTNSPAEFRLEPGTHTIQAKDDWWKSNPLTFMAAAGERVGVLYTPGPLAWHMKLSLLQ